MNLKMIDHPNIIKIYEYLESDKNCYIVMEYFEPIQWDLIQNEFTLKHIIFQILSGLKYLHETLKICHWDLKEDNILVNSKAEVKLIDFGLAKNFDKFVMNTNTGTHMYRPIEFEDQNYTESVDMWALGIICFMQI